MMKTTAVLPTILAFLVAVMLTAAPAFAQEITGAWNAGGFEDRRHDVDDVMELCADAAQRP